MKNDELSPSQVAAWLRAKGQRYLDMAVELERESGVTQTRLTPNSRVVIDPGSPEEPITADRIKQAIRIRSFRVPALAQHFGVTNKRIVEIIGAEDSGLRIGDRGWVKEVVDIDLTPQA